jgi:uncharacterized protein (TIGR02246 family)
MRRVILPLLLFAAACRPAAVEQQATTTGPDVEAVTAWLAQYADAVDAGDMETMLALIADDAVLIPPDAPPTSGMAAIRPEMESYFRDYTMQTNAQPDEVVVAGDLAFVRASYTDIVTPKGEGEPIEGSGVWLILLRKQSDGSWKLWREMYSVFPPAPPPAM